MTQGGKRPTPPIFVSLRTTKEIAGKLREIVTQGFNRLIKERAKAHLYRNISFLSKIMKRNAKETIFCTSFFDTIDFLWRIFSQIDIAATSKRFFLLLLCVSNKWPWSFFVLPAKEPPKKYRKDFWCSFPVPLSWEKESKNGAIDESSILSRRQKEKEQVFIGRFLSLWYRKSHEMTNTAHSAYILKRFIWGYG